MVRVQQGTVVNPSQSDTIARLSEGRSKRTRVLNGDHPRQFHYNFRVRINEVVRFATELSSTNFTKQETISWNDHEKCLRLRLCDLFLVLCLTVDELAALPTICENPQLKHRYRRSIHPLLVNYKHYENTFYRICCCRKETLSFWRGPSFLVANDLLLSRYP